MKSTRTAADGFVRSTTSIARIPGLYDMVVNFDHISVDNAAAALVTVAALPEFQQTPASRKELSNLLSAAKCRLAIGDDPRTQKTDVKVRVEGSKVTVTYPPRHESVAAAIPEILTSVAGDSRSHLHDGGNNHPVGSRAL